MKRNAFWILLSVAAIAWFLMSCTEEKLLSASCGTPATVRDLTSLDGCGYVFELTDGTRLIAVWEWGFCGTPPLPQGALEDPIYNFEYVDGKQVLIGFEERDSEWYNNCMAGKTVKITCLETVTTEK